MYRIIFEPKEVLNMKLRLYQPVNQFLWNADPIEESVNQLFERSLPLTALGEIRRRIGGLGAPSAPIDLYEDEANYYVKVECPGFKKEDLKVEVEDNLLTIQGSRKTENSSASFERRVELSTETDPEKISGEYKDGVLTVTLSKKREVQKQNIRVIPIK